MTRWFKGIDFANRQQNIGICYLAVTDQTLTAHFNDSDPEVEWTGIDCPFGTSVGFSQLLLNQAPTYESGDGYKTRRTERWLRSHLWEYETNTYWRKNVASDPQHYVNKTAHVQPTLGLQIVPGFLDWFRNEVSDAMFRDAIEAARRGDNAFLESHPRVFLYSAIEQIWRKLHPRRLTEHELRAVVQYKDKPKTSHAEKRAATYKLLKQHAALWLGNGYSLADPPDTLLSTDHAFDAWLSAVTAFAHAEGMTITWQDAGTSEEEVNVEGHILILKQKETAVASAKPEETTRG